VCGAHFIVLALVFPCLLFVLTVLPSPLLVLVQVGKLMKKASTLKIASQLREHTSYCTVRENDTRWSSTYNMIGRFLKIQDHLSEIKDLLSLLPNHLEVDILTGAFNFMKNFDSVTIMLQRDDMSFVESREIFDLFLKDYPDFEHYIGEDALIIENETFEKAVMRISRGMPLSDSQRRAALPLLKPADEIPRAEVDDDDNRQQEEYQSYSQMLQRKLKRQKRVTEAERQDEYINLEMLPGTSVNCERLFSAAKFILSDTRKRTSPSLFEALLLLKKNSSYWNVYSVGEAIGRTKKRPDFGDINNTLGDVDVDAIDEEEDDSDSDNESCSSSPGDMATSTVSSSLSSSASFSIV
jgi:hypothetical protein